MNYVDSWYMNEIGKIPLLSVEEEKALAEKYRNGDKKAFDVLVSSNLRFVVKTAMKYKGLGLDIDDLISEGNAGLMKAAAKFDPAQNVRFTTYAVWWIRESILKALYETGSMIRLPKAAGDDKKNLRFVSSLDVEIDCESGTTAGDLVMDNKYLSPEEEYLKKESREFVYSLYDGLSDKEKHVIGLRYGLNGKKEKSLSFISENMSYSKEGVRQMELRALNKMRKICESIAA